MELIKDKYNDVVTQHVLGHTYENRQINYFKVSKRPSKVTHMIIFSSFYFYKLNNGAKMAGVVSPGHPVHIPYFLSRVPNLSVTTTINCIVATSCHSP